MAHGEEHAQVTVILLIKKRLKSFGRLPEYLGCYSIGILDCLYDASRTSEDFDIHRTDHYKAAYIVVSLCTFAMK
jgi:hypothetical protein